ncbi:hypothetical protein F4821DRAFT_53271 [Hypoxylon rubiginosum]|uniref:Uncharacterized protein n=1 Tax=Hypoxylon rubiginosum TaxID=110542 RepID=A0ACC0CJM0_9PEZI|nr:hypothetical protein F4821DRAFT_53271 [Hypoxylon rubiginosum]
MELDPKTEGHVDHAQPQQITAILRSIDELVKATFEANRAAMQQNASNPDDSFLRSRQSALLQSFKDMMVTVHSKVSKATHEVEMQLGPVAHADRSHIVTDSQLDDLTGIDAGSEPNQYLGRTDLNGKPSYKLRDFAAGVEDFQLVVDDSSVAAPLPEGPLVVLQATQRNVWVLQHAYATISKHKENLIKKYLDTIKPEAGVSRKFAREYYEEPGLINLPTKKKLGNLLDVKRTSSNHETHDLTLVLVSLDRATGNLQYVEPVTGVKISIDRSNGSNQYLILPMTEASMKKLYDAYRWTRNATSDLRREEREREFAAKQNGDLQGDIMDGLQKQLNSIGGKENGWVFGMKTGKTNDDVTSSGKKRRRMLDDDEGRD